MQFKNIAEVNNVMPIKIDIKADLSEVRRMFKELGPAVDRAAARAINKTAIAVRKEAGKEIRKKRAIKATLIRNSMKITRAKPAHLEATITATGRSIPIRHFGANQTRRGVSVRIKQGGKRVLLQRRGNAAFINPALGPNVFVRKGKSRLPIRKWSPVPGIPRVFAQRHIQQTMRTVAGDVWPRRFREEVNFEIRKAAQKARRS